MPKVRIIEVDVPDEMIVDVIRAATSGREVGQQPTMRTIDADLPRRDSQPTELPPAHTPAALPPAQQTATATQTSEQPAARKSGKKRAGASSKQKSESGQSQAGQARQTQINAIIQAKNFDDFERYTAAIGKKGIGNLDLAALVARLAQTQFNFTDGIAASEVLEILRERFSINVPRKSMEDALRRSPRTFFSVAPAPFHHKAKLYRPMKDCIDRVDEILSEFDSARLTTVTNEGDSNGAVN